MTANGNVREGKRRMRGSQTLNPTVAWRWLIFYLPGVPAGCPFIEPPFAQELGLHTDLPGCHLAVYYKHAPFDFFIGVVPADGHMP